MNENSYRQLTEDECETLIRLSMIEKKDPESFLKLFDELKSVSFIIKLLVKRIEVFKLPKFEPSAIAILELLSEGNPGRAVLSLIETMEAYDKFHPAKIDMEFICVHVYPSGIYTTESFVAEWDLRKENMDSGYNVLIITK